MGIEMDDGAMDTYDDPELAALDAELKRAELAQANMNDADLLAALDPPKPKKPDPAIR